MLLSRFVPLSPFPTSVHKSVLYICVSVSALWIDSSVPFFYIPLLFSCPVLSDSFAAPWVAACQASLSFTIFWSLPKFMPILLVMPSSHLILWCPLLLLSSIFPSIRVFSNETAVCIRWPEYWSFSFSPFNECSGLISFRIDWFDLFAV